MASQKLLHNTFVVKNHESLTKDCGRSRTGPSALEAGGLGDDRPKLVDGRRKRWENVNLHMHDSLSEMPQILTLASADQLLPYDIQLRQLQSLASSNYKGKKGFKV